MALRIVTRSLIVRVLNAATPPTIQITQETELDKRSRNGILVLPTKDVAHAANVSGDI
jgi:hypothetical protein